MPNLMLAFPRHPTSNSMIDDQMSYGMLLCGLPTTQNMAIMLEIAEQRFFLAYITN